jgi:hypothetical protein
MGLLFLMPIRLRNYADMVHPVDCGRALHFRLDLGFSL